jgi:hypothetical protein
MPFTYSIDPEQRFVHVIAAGRITHGEAFATFDEVAAHPQFGGGHEGPVGPPRPRNHR